MNIWKRFLEIPKYLRFSILSLIIGLAPLLSALLAGVIADINGCVLHGGFVNSCYLLGVDIGGLLYFMGVIVWFSMLSLPLGVIFCIMFIAQYFIKKNRSKE